MENSNIILQKYHDLFNTSIALLLDLGIKNNNQKSQVYQKCVRFMEILENKDLDMDKTVSIIKKVFTLITNNLDLLKTNNQKLFSLFEKRDIGGANSAQLPRSLHGNVSHMGDNTQVKLTIIPGIDLEEIYYALDDEKRKNMWLYLNSLYFASCKMIGISNDKNISSLVLEYITLLEKQIKIDELYSLLRELYPNTNIIRKVVFNPFVGVGGNSDNGEFNINDILKNSSQIPGETPQGVGVGDFSSMTSMLGIDKMLNMDELGQQLKNINPEDIELATESITKLLGGNLDSGTSEMINTMLHGIKDELKKEDLTKGNPFGSLVKIAETVATQMIPKIEKGNVDMTKMWNSTKNLASNCATDVNNPLFKGKGNPLSLLTGLMEKQMNVINNPNDKKVQGDYMKEYNKLISGSNNIFQQFAQQNLPKTNNNTKNKKKK